MIIYNKNAWRARTVKRSIRSAAVSKPLSSSSLSSFTARKTLTAENKVFLKSLGLRFRE